MGIKCKLILVLTAAACLFASIADSQDSPSLGDLARQQRQQKEHSKTGQDKNAKASKVITNEEIREHAAPASASAASDEASHSSTLASSDGVKPPADQVKAQILAQKTQIATLQSQADELNQSIRFAPANCVENCVSWNEHQKEKQEQVERMQAQLEEEKKRLEEMQDSARKQGFGSSVYDP
jgi:hypothetical protein